MPDTGSRPDSRKPLHHNTGGRFFLFTRPSPLSQKIFVKMALAGWMGRHKMARLRRTGERAPSVCSCAISSRLAQNDRVPYPAWTVTGFVRTLHFIDNYFHRASGNGGNGGGPSRMMGGLSFPAFRCSPEEWGIGCETS